MAVLKKVDGKIIITEGKDDVLVTAQELAVVFGVGIRSIWRYKNKGMPYTQFAWRVIFSVDKCLTWAKENNIGIPTQDKVYAHLSQERIQKTRETKARNEEKGE